MSSRLPIVGSDNNNWGSILSEYLRTEHKVDGTHGLASGLVTDIVNTVSNSGASYTIPSGETAGIHDITLTANCTLTLPDAVAGRTFTLILRQGGSGSYSITWPSGIVKWQIGLAPRLKTLVGAVDFITFLCADGVNWLGFCAEQDVTGPVPTISCSESSPTSARTMTATITFNEPVTGFTGDDVNVGEGSKSTFSTVSTRVFTQEIVTYPLSSVTVDVSPGVCSDLSGNSNVTSNQVSVDTTWNEGVDDAFTAVLLHANGDNESTTFTDESGKIWSGYGNAKLSTAQSKFGGSALLLNGATYDYIYTSDHTDFNFGSGAFTLDCWIYLNTIFPPPYSGYMPIFSQYQDSNNHWVFFIYSNVNNQGNWFFFRSRVAGVDQISLWRSFDSPLTPGSWHHVEIGRSGNNFYMFLDGLLCNDAAVSDSDLMYDFEAPLSVGSYPGLTTNTLNGYVDEIRVSKGVCRHTTDFNVATTEYHASSAEAPLSEAFSHDSPTNVYVEA